MNSKNTDFKIFFALFFLFFSIHMPNLISNKSKSVPFIIGDDRCYRAMVISILNDHDLFLENNIPKEWRFQGLLALGKNADLVPMHSIMMPIFSVPFYHFLGDNGLLLFNIINSFVIFLFIFLINKQFHDDLVSFLVSVSYAIGTLFFAYTYSYSSDVFSTLFFLISVYLILRYKFIFGIVFLGFSVFAKMTNIIFLPVMLIFISYVIFFNKNSDQKNPKKFKIYQKVLFLFLLILVFLLSLLPMLLTNNYLYGSPLTSGYQLSVIGKNISGNFVLKTHTSMFNQPLLKGIFLNLFDPLNGLLFTNPILIFSFFGFITLLKSKRFNFKLNFLFFFCLLNFIFIAKFDGWINSHFSNRYLMVFIALSSVFSGFYINKLKTFLKNFI